MPNEFQYVATLQMDQMIRSLHNIDKNMEDLATTGTRAFGATGKAAQGAGKQIGITSGITASLTFELINMGKAGVKAFKDLIVESVKLAGQAQVTQASLTGIFAGQTNQQQLAIDTFSLLRQQNRELGVDLSRLAPNFLPFVEEWEDFVRLGKQATALAALDPQAGIEGATRALRDAVSGEFRALRQIFEIDTDPIIEAVKEFGEVEGVIIGLETILKERGQDFEQLKDTVVLAIQRIKAEWTDALMVLGAPIADQLKDDLTELGEIIQENKIEIDILLDTFGMLVAMIANLIAEAAKGKLLGIDLEELTSIILEMQKFLALMSELSNVLAQDDSAWDQFRSRIFDIETAFTAANQILQVFIASMAGAIAQAKVLGEITKRQFSGDAVDMSETFGDDFDTFVGAGQEAFNESLRKTLNITNELTETFEERAQAIRDNANADEDLVDSGLALNKALKDQQALAAELGDLEEERSDARQDLADEDDKAAMDRAELAMKQERARSDLEMKLAEARAKAQRKFMDDLEKIARKHQDRLNNLRIDTERDRMDAIADFQQDRIDLEREEAKELEEIEKNHFRELIRIRERFEFEIADAIRKQDAIAFVDAVRRAERARDEARRERDEETEDAKADFDERREEIEASLQAELEAINKANRRAIEDLNRRLSIELRERRIAREIELRELALAEERKRKEQEIAFQRQNEDLARKLRERRMKFVDALQKIEQDFKAHLARMQEIDRKINSLGGGRRRGSRGGSDRDPDRGGRTPGRPGINDPAGGSADSSSLPNIEDESESSIPQIPQHPRHGDPIPARQSGGPVRFGQSYLVGEQGPEILKMFSNGMVIPSNLSFGPTGGNTTNNSVSNQLAMNLGMLTPDSLSPQQLQIVQEMIGQTMIELLSAGASA